MAHKRMFSKTITDSDDFLEMPVSTRLLYYDLGMNADDDGFIQPNRIIKTTGATSDDLKVLIAKKMVIPFAGGRVLVIADWRVNNTIRKDRYSSTIFTEFKKLIKVSTEGKYVLGKPSGNQMATVGMHSIEEDSIGEDSIATNVAKEEPFNQEKYIQKMRENTQSRIRLIGWYFDETKEVFPTLKSIQSEVKRWLVDADFISQYNNDQIGKTFNYVKKEFPEQWKLSTIRKYISKQ